MGGGRIQPGVDVVPVEQANIILLTFAGKQVSKVLLV